MRYLRRTLLTCAAGLALSSPALADPALWKVSDADSEIYLFGSVHVFTREVATGVRTNSTRSSNPPTT